MRAKASAAANGGWPRIGASSLARQRPKDFRCTTGSKPCSSVLRWCGRARWPTGPNDATIKTPPGIGRRFESRCRGRWQGYYIKDPGLSIPVARIDAVEFAQERRPDQHRGAQFRALRVAEQRAV